MTTMERIAHPRPDELSDPELERELTIAALSEYRRRRYEELLDEKRRRRRLRRAN